jgi:hypothetical protein
MRPRTLCMGTGLALLVAVRCRRFTLVSEYRQQRSSAPLVVKTKRKSLGRTAEICARPSILRVPSV